MKRGNNLYIENWGRLQGRIQGVAHVAIATCSTTSRKKKIIYIYIHFKFFLFHSSYNRKTKKVQSLIIIIVVVSLSVKMRFFNAAKGILSARRERFCPRGERLPTSFIFADYRLAAT